MRRGFGISSLTRGLFFHGNVRVIAFTSLMTGIYVSMLNAVLQPFAVTGLGVGVFVLGILTSVGGRPTGLASSLIQPLAGFLADNVGRKKLVVAGSAVAIGSMLSFLDAALSHNISALALGYILFGASLLGTPATQVMVAESVEMDLNKMNVAFSVVFFFTQVPGAAAAIAGGFIAQFLGYYLVFASAVVLESVNLVLLVRYLKETGQSRRLRDVQRPRFSLKNAVRLPPGFLRMFSPFAMDAFSYGLAGSIIYGIWVKQFGFTSADTGLVAGTISLSIVASQYPATVFLRRVGIRLSLAIAEFLTVVIMLGWLLFSSLPVFIILAAVFGISVALWVPAINSLTMSVVPPEQRGSVSGKLTALRGLVAVPSPIIGGFLFNAYGYALPVTLGLVGEAITTLAILRFVPGNGQVRGGRTLAAELGRPGP